MRSEVAGRLAALAAAVDGVAECPGLGLPAEELTELLRGVFREGTRLEAAFTSLVGALDRLEQERLNGQGVCQAWLAGELHVSEGAAHGRVRLARALPTRPETAASFDTRKRRDGSFEFTGHTGVEQGTRLRTAIEGVLGRKAKQDGRSPGQRRMDALDELARRALDSGELPARAGQKPHLLVSTTLETLRGDPGAGVALLNWKTPISGEMVRRIATDAELIPMLVDQQGNPLWLGRRRRTSTDKQFLALMHRDRRCRWPGCNREADHCQGHHRTPWAKGGETNLEDLALFCPYHHTLWTEGHRPKRLPDGRVITVPPGEQLKPWFGPAVAERPPPPDPVGP